MNWGILLVSSLALMPVAPALAGIADAELTCKSESGKVALAGVLPVDTDRLNLVLTYMGKKLAFSDTDDFAYIVENLRKGVFTMLIKRANGDNLELYALPNTVVDLHIPGSEKDFDFDAMLTGPRPGGPFEANGRSVNPLKATLKCRYHYSI